ncbi:site-specific DNA-methyltransferase [Clostridium lacusfryxellense]|uniref:site-specific DNA-methyltransferase n=1 Tax=Clostridium lacusfryxellense TaxID=205328 RepID=UPI001C0AEB2F|nr:site-specific DNA-methyltransferase [Clostridium lacusfryxellense]MBU3114040.1 site-specific DNA-methyltransferase [Clostridium lacusfryxellense]
MDKLNMESINMTQKNIEGIGALFPNVITEMIDEGGNLKRGINFELLKQELASDVIDGEECYDFNWAGKKAAIVEWNTPIRKTLRPCINESKDWETTGNLYIEGDNLDVLKLLQESYLNSIKMIYIDPPYNTGNDFIYKDNFTINKDEYDEQIGRYDEEENQLFQNTESNGRFHSDWCSMIYPRLKLAQNLLADDGVIFISIDNNEVANLKKICDEVFGESNFIEQIPWIKRVSPANDSQWYSGDHEFILIYAKYKNNWFPKRTKRTAEHDKYYKNADNDPRGPWNSAAYTCNKSRSKRPNLYYAIVNPNTGEEIYPNENAVWAYSKDTHKENVKNGLLYWGANGQSKSPRRKQFLTEAKDVVARSYWHFTEVGSTQTATTELRNLFDGASFSYPKPVSLLKKIIYQATNPDTNDIILDFFSGSATTAHAAMLLNAEDGGNRKYIMVQLPEVCDEKGEDYKAGYNTICEIGKDRVRRAGDKIKEELIKNNAQMEIKQEEKPLIDIGLRVLKVDSANMKDVYYAANEYSQSMIEGLESNIKEDRTDLDLLYGVILDWGLTLSLSHKIEEIEDVTVHTVDNGSLVACFAENVSESVVREIAKRQPLRVVFRDSSFATSQGKINLLEIFKQFFKCNDEEVRNRVKVI